MKSAIQSVNVTYLVHATEDQTKIQKAVDRLLGIAANPTIERMEGHFGNEILRAEIQVTGETATAAFKAIASKIGPELNSEIREDPGRYLDEHSAMFLRFDKQSLISGSVVLGYPDSIRIKIKPRAYLAKGGAISLYGTLLKGG